MKTYLTFVCMILLIISYGILSPVFGQWIRHNITGNQKNPVALVDIGDIDGDDTLDVVASHNETDEVVWFKNKNAGQIWEEDTIDYNLEGAWCVWIADIDGDDDLDVVANGQDANDVVWYENLGGNPISWKKHFIDDDFEDARGVAIADIDGDDTLDVIVSSYAGDDVVWYENNHPTWSQNKIEDNLDGANYVYPADLDGDDDPDVIVGGFRADRIVWYENNLPDWTPHDLDPSINGPVIIDTADIDGDGDLDVAATGEYDNDVLWYENQGGNPISWKEHVIDGNLNSALGIAIGYLDDDHKPDIITAGLSDNNKVVWYKNDLPSDSWTPEIIQELDYPEIVKVGDIDRDNDLDVVLATFGTYAGTDDGDIYWYEYRPDVAMPNSMQSYHPKYIPPDGANVIINTQLYNPEYHPVTVHAIIRGEQHAFTDSIPLYDDGQHYDSLASDNIWGNSKWMSGLPEDMYTIGISTHDLMKDFRHDLSPVRCFTTIGPVVFDHFEFTSTDTVPNPGDRIRIKMFLRNDGSVETALNITAELTTLDPGVIVGPTTPIKYGDIAAGDTNESSSSYRISFNGPFDKYYYQVPFAIDIRSDDYSYWIDTTSIIVGIEQQRGKPIPKEFTLYQNFPNPFNPSTSIGFDLPKTSDVTLKIFNILGEEVVTLVSDQLPTGSYLYEWDASGFSSGVYYYQLVAGDYREVKKMVLLR